MLAIKNNIMASNAARHLGKAYDSLATSVERLASGLRINSAKDDAAGMAVRELVRADVAVIQQGARNAQDGISMLQTMEGAMGVIDDNLIRMKELAEQAATGSYSADQRTIMNAEFAEMAAEIDRIAGATSFNGIKMLQKLSGATEDIEIHVGTDETISIARQDMTKAGLGIATGNTGATIVASSSVTGLDQTYFSVIDDAAGAATDTFKLSIAFTDTDPTTDVAETTVDVEFGITDGGTKDYTLQQVIDKINLVSQNLGNGTDGVSLNYQMASAKLDTSGNYFLQLDSNYETADAVSITTISGSSDVHSSGFITTAAADAVTAISDAAGSFGTAAVGAGINILTATAAQDALVSVSSAITTKDAARAAFGYKMNRLESTISILDIQAENLMSAESRISDVDVATEMATLTRTQVLSQAGIAMLSQANSMPQMALSLLR
ncbi:MAG: flagellin [Phycisphaerales bacterium]